MIQLKLASRKFWIETVGRTTCSHLWCRYMYWNQHQLANIAL